MSYRDELEAAQQRIAQLEAKLGDAERRVRDSPPTVQTPTRPRRRWQDVAVSASVGLAAASLAGLVMRLRGGTLASQLVTTLTSIVGPGWVLAMGTLMILDAHPLEDVEERKKRRWGWVMLVFGWGLWASMTFSMPVH